LHLIVPADRFKLISGRDALSTYSFNTHVAKHFFCSVCGVKSLLTFRGRIRMGSASTARCIDSDTIESMAVQPFDGRNGKRPGRNTAQAIIKCGAGRT